MMDCISFRCIPGFFVGWRADFCRSKKEDSTCLPEEKAWQCHPARRALCSGILLPKGGSLCSGISNTSKTQGTSYCPNSTI